MAGFEKQPSSRTQRTSSGNFDDSLSEITSTRDSSEAFRRERLHRQEADQLYQRLQGDYGDLLTKYAQAENTIDQLRIGAKLNLYSDLPPPQQSTAVTVPREKHPQRFSFPKTSQAILSNPSGVSHHRPPDYSSESGTVGHATIEPLARAEGDSDSLTPEVRAEGIRTSLMFQVESLQENVEDLQSNVMDGEWREPELRELHEICTHLIRQHSQMKRELGEAKSLESRARGTSISGNESINGDFLHEDSLEGQLYRLGLRLDEVNEQIDGNLRQISPGPARSSTQSNRTNEGTKGKTEKLTHGELQGLMERLRHIKDSSKNDDALSRSANSLADVEDLDLNEEGPNVDDRSPTRDFSLDPFPDDYDNDHEKKGEPGVDLQESGYFASETMSVSNGDPPSEPLSTHYLSNSGGGQQHFPGDRGDNASFFDQQSVTSSPERGRRLSGSSQGTSPDVARSRATSQRSRTNTVDTNTSMPQGGTSPSADYPEFSSPESPPHEPVLPQASSSMLPEQTGPHSRRSRAGTTESRTSRDRVGSDTRASEPRQSTGYVDILRTDHDTREPDRSRDRTASTHSSPRNTHDAFNESMVSSPRRDSKVSVQRQAGHKRPSMSSADSRVSTPLFLPHPGTRPKDASRRNKQRPATAETERGFDSGFFGSEGSRVSRSVYSPEIPPSHYPEDKIHRPALREQSVTESEGERFHVPASYTPLRSAPRYRDQRRRRSRLQSLSETDEDRGLDSSPSKTPLRSSSSQRERRGHHHTPTFPATRSDNDKSKRVDDSLRRSSSSPNLFDPSSDRLNQRSVLGRSSRTPSRHDSSRRSMVDMEATPRTGPRSDQDGRPMDKQSMRSYPGMDRESVRSGRRSRKDGDSSSAYSDSARKYKRDPVDKLREELQGLRTQLQDEASARSLQAHMYDDLRRKHDDLDREIARKNAEQQMTNMYDGLRRKYDELSRSVGTGRDPNESPRLEAEEALKKRLEALAKEVNDLKNRGNEGGPGTVRFLCPFCGGFGGHHHGDYYYPGFSGPVPLTPVSHRPSTPTAQTPYGEAIPQHVRHPTTPAATSTPLFQG